jgi:uncharacterized membrane protein
MSAWAAVISWICYFVALLLGTVSGWKRQYAEGAFWIAFACLMRLAIMHKELVP